MIIELAVAKRLILVNIQRVVKTATCRDIAQSGSACVWGT